LSEPGELTLDPEEARRQTARRHRELNLVVYPRTRLLGNLMVVVAVGLHNAFLLESFSWPALARLAAGILLYSLLSWLLLYAWYEKVRALDLGVMFLALDVVVWTCAIYASGAERSWLFFLMLMRAADQRFGSVRRLLAFGHISVASYALMLAYVVLVDGRPITWGRALTTLFFLWGANIYLALTARTAESLRARLVEAIRLARQANARHEDALFSLRESEARYRNIFENAAEPVVTFGRDGIILNVNRAAETMLGYGRQELVGRSFSMLVTPEEAARSSANLRRLIAGEALPQRTLVEVIRKDRSIVLVEPRTHVIHDTQGRPVGVQGIYRDMTDRVQAEMALRDAKEAAEAASRAKSQFLASMSHELRTPLNSVIGFSKVLLNRTDGDLTEPQALYVRTIHDNSTHLLRLIDEILDIARIEAGKAELVREDVPLAPLIEECLQASRSLLADKPVGLETDIPPNLGPVSADRTKLKQVLLNLVGNAVKFTASGRILVTVREVPDAVQVSVADTGRGIPAVELTRIFDPFRQVPAPGPTTSGVGLGLAICKTFVELHQGRIWAESDELRGSTFHFTIPRGGEPA
jgi:PAS domain S-box-containing protein